VSPPSSAPSSPNISFNIKPLGGGEVKGKASPPKVLLPKMDVKLNLHEEVTSKTGKEGMMEIFVEGKLMVSFNFIIFIAIPKCYKRLFLLNALSYTH
jgi:hypothetical protein